MKPARVDFESILLGELWAYGPAENAECWGEMVFLRFGRIFGYQNANENSWDLKSGALRLKNKNGEPTSVYERLSMHAGRPRLLGRSLLTPGAIFRLDMIENGSG